MLDTPHIILLGAIALVVLLQVVTMVMLIKTKSQVADADGILRTLQDDVNKGKTAILQAYNELVNSGLIPKV